VLEGRITKMKLPLDNEFPPIFNKIKFAV